jgi:heptosyltransferase-3
MKILFITATRIGDAVLTTGLLDHLIKTHPGAKITVAAGPVAAPLFAATPGVERILPMEKRRYGGHWLALWSEAVGTWWDIVVDVRRSALAYLLLASKRFVLGPERGGHRVLSYAKAMKLDFTPPAPRIRISAAQEAEAHKLIPGEEPVLAIGPTANWVGKTWPPERFVELIKRLTGDNGILPGARVAILGAQGERDSAQAVLDSVHGERLIDLVGGVDLLTAAACLKRCTLYIGNDSGLMHLSAASGTPTLGLFGPSRDDFYGPWGENCAFVRTDLGFDKIFGPNAEKNFNHRTTGSLMGTLSVDKAEAAARDLWAKVSEGAS